MSYLSGAKKAGVIFRKIRGKIIPIVSPSAVRIDRVAQKAARHQAGKSKDVVKKSLVSNVLKKEKKRRKYRNFRNASLALGGAGGIGAVLGYREGRTTYLKGR